MMEKHEESRRAAQNGSSWAGCSSDPGWRQGMHDKGLNPDTGSPYETPSFGPVNSSSSFGGSDINISGGGCSPVAIVIGGLLLLILFAVIPENKKEYTKSDLVRDMKSWQDKRDEKFSKLASLPYSRKELSDYQKHQRKYEEKMLENSSNQLAWVSGTIYSKHQEHAFYLQNCGKERVVMAEPKPGDRVVVVKNNGMNCLFSYLDHVKKKNNYRQEEEFKDYPICGTWYPCDALEF